MKLKYLMKFTIKKNDRLNIDQFIIKYFKKTDNKNDKYHIEKIQHILEINGYDMNKEKPITTMFTKLNIGIYNKNITIERVKKAGFYNLLYVPPNNNSYEQFIYII